MTKKGFDQLKADLQHLITVERPKNVKDIESARAHGDISENAEFHAAKERQSHIAAQMEQIEDRIARAQVIDPTGQSTDRVRFGATVVLSDSETEEEVTYTIVGEDEADASAGLISVTSPVARAVIGKGIDDEIQVRAPKGTRLLEILAIRYDG
jgi:transcription elongation factor GreA